MSDVYGLHRKARDRTQISAQDPLQVRYWATTLRCTQAELHAALSAVGPNREQVEKLLREHASV